MESSKRNNIRLFAHSPAARPLLCNALGHHDESMHLQWTERHVHIYLTAHCKQAEWKFWANFSDGTSLSSGGNGCLLMRIWANKIQPKMVSEWVLRSVFVPNPKQWLNLQPTELYLLRPMHGWQQSFRRCVCTLVGHYNNAYLQRVRLIQL